MIGFENGIFPISFDYKSNLEELISAGKYDVVEGEITSDIFSLSSDHKQRISEVDIELAFCTEKFVFVSDFIKNLARIGYHPLGIRELLVFGAKYPIVQLSFPVLEIGDAGFLSVNCEGVVCKQRTCTCRHSFNAYLFKKLYYPKKRSLYVCHAENMIMGHHSRIIVARVKSAKRHPS